MSNQRLRAASELDPERLAMDHGWRRLKPPITCLPEVDSSNAYLLSAPDAHDGRIVFAEHQTAGRGRHGRRWQSPRGASLLVSVLLDEPAGSPLLTRATFIGALAACDAIEASTDCQAQVRWPNDVTIQRRKVCGVLAEGNQTAGRTRLALGIGINCLQQQAHFPSDLPRATSLDLESTTPVERSRVARALLDAIDARLTQAADDGSWKRALDAWRQRCADLGMQARLTSGGREFAGTIVEITPLGDLVVQLDEGGRRCFNAAHTTRAW